MRVRRFTAKFWAFLLLFVFIYSPFFQLAGYLIKLPIIVHLAFGLLGLPAAVDMYRSNRLYRVSILILMLNLTTFLALLTLHGAIDFDGVRLAVSALATFIGASYFVARYRRLYTTHFEYELFFSIFLVGVGHAMIIVGMLVSEPLSNWMQSTFYYTEKTLEVWSARAPGLVASGFGALSLSQGMTALVGAMLLFAGRSVEMSIGRKTVIALGLPIVIVSTLLSGRAGFIALLSALVLFVVLNGRQVLLTRQGVRVLALSILGLALLLYGLLSLTEVDEYGALVRWGFEYYFTYLDEGKLATRSSDIVLESMYFLPEGLVGKLVGTGDFGRLEPPLPTDVGYILLIFGGGFVGLLSAMSIFAYFTIVSLTSIRTWPVVGNAVVLITVMLLLTNLKDPFLFHIFGISQITFLLYATLLSKLDRAVTQRPTTPPRDQALAPVVA